MSKDEDGDWICLHPYNHQVGGHSGVCLLDKTTVCKPLVQEEYGIYETMSPALKLFVPKLKGTASLVLHHIIISFAVIITKL